MKALFLNFFLDIIGEAGSFLSFALSEFLQMVFYIEKFIESQNGASGLNLHRMWLILYGVGISLLVVKCLKKGFEQYILWTDGDADNPPIEMLVKSAKAIAVAACFPTLYEWLVDITMWLTNQLSDAVNLSVLHISSLKDLLINTFLLAGPTLLLGALLTFIYLIMFMVLFVQFIKNGLEMLVLRLGVPLGVIGYVDSDGGLSKNYFKLFFQCALTALLQVVLFKFSMGLWISAKNPVLSIIAIAAMLLAIKAPKFISQFLVQTGGGSGGMSNIYFASQMADKAARLFAKK